MVLQTIALPLGYASALPPLAAFGAHREMDYTARNAAGQWNRFSAEIDTDECKSGFRKFL